SWAKPRRLRPKYREKETQRLSTSGDGSKRAPMGKPPWEKLVVTLSPRNRRKSIRRRGKFCACPGFLAICDMLLGRIRSIFSYSPKVLLSAMLYCKENGLPRRCAPRNDMQRLAGCLRVQGCAA